MCGIAGIWQPLLPQVTQTQQQTLDRMVATLDHRGPDAQSTWTNQRDILLGHSRLAIHDLSDCGRQPMHSHCGRFVIVFNGEIYNFAELKQQLSAQGVEFQTRCDTEVLIAAVVNWGLADALARFNGMFAFALWDNEQRTLSLARDRTGKKPLYYAVVKGQLIFASELKALQQHPDFNAQINLSALQRFLQYNCVAGTESIYQGVHKFAAAQYVTLTPENINDPESISRNAQFYWDPLQRFRELSSNPYDLDAEQATDKLEQILHDATALRLDADVPVGLMLSGGIDSSLVASIAQQQSSRPINTFSIGFTDSKNSEAAAAKAIAGHLGTSHNELYLSSQDALDVLPKIPTMFDEPFADSSQIPTYIVSKLARSKVTVALSGDGGDELFFGYKRYLSSAKLWRLQQKLALVRKPLGGLLSLIERGAATEKKLAEHANTLRANNFASMYAGRLQQFIHPERLLTQSQAMDESLIDEISALGLSTPENNAMLFDFRQYLCDDILVKTDRASMANSLELRSPLLDSRVVEFAWQTPFGLKYRNGKGKFLLREVLNRYVPLALTDRPKQGFGSPVKAWLRTDLRDWAEDLLDARFLKQQGLFDVDAIKALWDKTMAGNSGYSKLWTILMFQAWYKENVKSFQ